MRLKELPGWDAFCPNGCINHLCRSVPIRYPARDIEKAYVFILRPQRGCMRASISMPEYAEEWTVEAGQISSDYIDDTNNQVHVADAGPIETRGPIETLEELAEFLIEYVKEIDVETFIDAYNEAMGDDNEL